MYWAADRLLAALHPPTRSFDHHCWIVRDMSLLAHGEQNDKKLDHDVEEKGRRLLCQRYIARAVRFGEESTMWREIHTDESLLKEFDQKRQLGYFESLIDRGSLTTRKNTDGVPDPASKHQSSPASDCMQTRPKRLNSFPRNNLSKWTETKQKMMEGVNNPYSLLPIIETIAKDRGVWYGIEELARAESSCQIAYMFHANYRANYNFNLFVYWNWPCRIE